MSTSGVSLWESISVTSPHRVQKPALLVAVLQPVQGVHHREAGSLNQMLGRGARVGGIGAVCRGMEPEPLDSTAFHSLEQSPGFRSLNIPLLTANIWEAH